MLSLNLEDCQSKMTLGRYIQINQKHDSYHISIAVRKMAILKIALILTLMLILLTIEIPFFANDPSFQPLDIRYTITLWVVFFLFFLCSGLVIISTNRNKITIMPNSDADIDFKYQSKTISLGPKTEICITRYAQRFNNWLKSQTISLGDETIELEPHPLMTQVLYCLAAQFPIKLVEEIDHEVPIDKIDQEKLKRIEVRQKSSDYVVIGLSEDPDKTSVYRLVQMMNFSIPVVIGLVICYYMFYWLFHSVNQALSRTIGYGLIILFSFIVANYLMSKDTPVQELRIIGHKMVIGSLEVDIPRNAWLEQKTIFIQEKMYLDSCIAWDGNVVFLPFFKDVEKSAKMNHEISIILDLAIVLIS